MVLPTTCWKTRDEDYIRTNENVDLITGQIQLPDLAIVPHGLIAFGVNIICVQGDIGKFPLQALRFYRLKGCFANKVSRLEQVQTQTLV